MEYYIADARRQLLQLEEERKERLQKRQENITNVANIGVRLGDAYVRNENMKASEMMQADPTLQYSDEYMSGDLWSSLKRPFTRAENRFKTDSLKLSLKDKPITGESLMNDPQYQVSSSPYTNAMSNVQPTVSANSSVPTEYGNMYDNATWEATQKGVESVKKLQANADFKGFGGKGVREASDYATAIPSEEVVNESTMQGLGGTLGKVAGGIGTAASIYDLYKNADGEFDGEDALKLTGAGLGALGMLGMVNPALGVGLAGGKMLYDWWENR